ncbi:DUF4974 domain-containing protein [Maribellus comscasis]|uniref:DUF4974 domain-containing protein n=1 Tax=Maribellus comscasis TaxID=2681766 RepID=A0A6I6JXA8_9BACT|nr:FecR family protein [Maribellus comscasis]QGY47796.1 DUF4974 domain-containing protein [Maribellus comscasis]
MSQQKIHVLRKFFTKSYNDNDLKKLFLWFNSEKGHDEIADVMDTKWKSFKSEDVLADMDSVKMLTNIQNRIRRDKTIQIRNNFIKIFPYAAILAVIIGFSVLFYLNNIPSRSRSDLYTSVITENGQRSKVVLPDSSIVWLNSGTTLSYNYSLDDVRSIILSGQGFFQITRNENKPFVVQCGEINVKVLGTKFDVNAYPVNDKISVVLESGSVVLKHDRCLLNYVLKPGEKADYDITEKNVKVSEVDVKKFTSWKDGKLIFKNDPMKLVIEELERWYNIEIEVEDQEVYNSIFTGTVINESYPQIFKLIEYSCPVNCEIVNNLNPEEIPKIIITKQ